ncbi:hypothetical protein KCMC57_up04900 [Kitasatospora sp. CMC57]|uniref:UspA domain-containing protein n=1 Tax=Kitasatospora sp. CMC57 TaxID=3231513 RepID=A0AB33JMS2_9ACTN
MDYETPAVRRIVVGVDGSPMFGQALRWVIEQARLAGSAVDAWTCPTMVGRAMTEFDPQIGRTAESHSPGPSRPIPPSGPRCSPAPRPGCHARYPGALPPGKSAS